MKWGYSGDACENHTYATLENMYLENARCYRPHAANH